VGKGEDEERREVSKKRKGEGESECEVGGKGVGMGGEEEVWVGSGVRMGLGELRECLEAICVLFFFFFTEYTCIYRIPPYSCKLWVVVYHT
jgi:hypothetical protein